MSRNYENCAPEAGAMISSLRAFGYDFATAIADLIDNSLFARASNISVEYSWDNGKPWFRITDDGCGMTEKTLKAAMRLGSTSPLEERQENDLGRFGLGLKTAAFSQGKLLTVKSKTTKRNAVIRCWDLDHVAKTNRWDLSLRAPADSEHLLNSLDKLDHGTVVLCQNLDRLTLDIDDPEAEDNFHEKFQHVANYLEMVFHRFLSGKQKVKIRVGRHECRPWDPFLESNSFTQKRYEQKLSPRSIEVAPFILPHVSKRTQEESSRGSGLYGWNAHQGFYVYRNKRMIIAGGYLDFDFKSEEHHKLCRIRIDLPNSVDHEWGIDVRKATASPPSHVRRDLERIAKSTRNEACEIYRARTGTQSRRLPRASKGEIWSRHRKGEKIVYTINRENEAIAQLMKKHQLKKKTVNQLFHLIEHSIPHRNIVIDNTNHEDCLVDLPPDLDPPSSELIKICENIFRGYLRKQRDPHEARKITISCMPPHVAYGAHIDKIIEKME